MNTQASLIPESPQQVALRELVSAKCICGKRKKERESFCKACYYALPRDLRSKLYLSFSSGYVIHYEEAKRWLSENGGAA